MSEKQTNRANTSATEPTGNIIINYTPAVLRHQNSHGWSVEYYAADEFGKLRRMVIRMNAIRKRFSRLSDFKAYCNQVACGINAKLAGGWTPFGEQQNSRLYTPIDAVAKEYIKEKSLELRPDTVINYRSFVKVFLEWVSEVCPGIQVSAFNWINRLYLKA